MSLWLSCAEPSFLERMAQKLRRGILRPGFACIVEVDFIESPSPSHLTPKLLTCLISASVGDYGAPQ
jgi:hypothetical protein